MTICTSIQSLRVAGQPGDVRFLSSGGSLTMWVLEGSAVAEDDSNIVVPMSQGVERMVWVKKTVDTIPLETDATYSAPSAGDASVTLSVYTAVNFAALDVGNLGLSALSTQVATITKLVQALMTTLIAGKLPAVAPEE